MNGKNPIDDLFARTLRDAEAQPPPAVWEGIVRERDRSRRAPVKRRSRWGLAALLLLLLGSAGYWALSGKEEAPRSGNEHASIAPSQQPDQQAKPDGAEGRATSTTPQNTTTTAALPSATGVEPQVAPGGKPTAAGSPSTASDPAHADANTQDTGNRKQEKLTKRPASVTDQAPSTRGRRERAQDPEESHAAVVTPSDAIGSLQGPEVMTTQGDEAEPLMAPTSVGTNGAGPLDHVAGTPAGQNARLAPDFHMPVLTTLATPFISSTATAPGPILNGDTTPTYVLSPGQWWIAVQGEWAMLNGEWKGSGHEVPELNTSETWRGGQGLSLVVGRKWLNGWSVGLGIGASKQRSRFLRREVEASHTETVVDTTWTGTAMGAQTNYTWDIVETVQTEPGIEHDYSATNSYTRLRIAPEVSYQLLQKKRFVLSARLAPVMMFDIGREGNTIVPSSSTDSLETTTYGTVAAPVNDASLDERFPMAFALSAGLEVRYRICERWSVGALPTFTYWIPRAEGAVPALSMNELGGALRLRYDLRHQERRVK
jgi:cytoskeletal protein RodZ